MRVALVTGIYPKPSETFVVGHVSSMIAMGHSVTVVAGDLKSDDLPETGAEHFDLKSHISPYQSRTFARHKLLMKWWGPLQKAKLKGLSREEKLRAAVLCDKWKDFPPDVVYAHFATNGIMAAAACKRLGIPLIVNFHGFDFTSYPLKHGWWRFQRWLTDAHLVSHTEYCAGVLKKELCKDSSIIRLGIDPTKFKQKQTQDEWPKNLRFVVVGRLIFQKGQDVAIKALKLVKDALSDHEVELRFLGDGDYQVELEQLASELDITENIKFLGSVPHTTVASEMHDADIQIVPSRTGKNGAIENVGTVSLEGLCTGLAVVASRSGGLPESVGDGGVLVEPDDPEALAGAIIDVVRNSTPAEMKSRALNQAAKFTFEGMTKGYAEILEKAVNG